MKNFAFILLFVPFLSFGQLKGTFTWNTTKPVTVESLTKNCTVADVADGQTIYQGTKKVKGVLTTYFFIIVKDEKTGKLKRKTVYKQ